MGPNRSLRNPDAARPNGIVIATTAFVLDDRRTDNALWALPGGAQDFGEYIAETAVRETKEESGTLPGLTGRWRRQVRSLGLSLWH